MDCPYCRSASRVIDSRSESDKVLRRRKCLKCEKLFFTTELEVATSREDFNRLSRAVALDRCKRKYLNGGLKK